MKVVLQVCPVDTAVIGLTRDSEVAERIISDAFKDVRFGEEELVKIEYEGVVLYTSRSKALADEDEFEYIDNDGTPIEADGSPKGEKTVGEVPEFEYTGEYFWLVKNAEEDQTISVSASDYFMHDIQSLLEAHENIVIP